MPCKGPISIAYLDLSDIRGKQVYQFFVPRSSSKSPVRLPKEYRDKSRWHPRLGDTFPFCTFNTSVGTKNLIELAGGNWIYFFSLPQAFAPICTAELASFARYQSDFHAIGVSLIALSQSTVQRQRDWFDMVESQLGIKVGIACIEDPNLSLAKCFGIVHPRESSEQMIRKSFVLDPKHKIRSIIEYPAGIIRNAAEALGHVDNLLQYDQAVGQIATSQTQLSGPLSLFDPSKHVVPRRVSSKHVFQEAVSLRGLARSKSERLGESR